MSPCLQGHGQEVPVKPSVVKPGGGARGDDPFASSEKNMNMSTYKTDSEVPGDPPWFLLGQLRHVCVFRLGLL